MSEAVSAPLLHVSGAEVTYPARWRGGLAVRAVDGVDLDVAPGEVLALVGESGCGKTTLARAVLGLQPLSGGSIRFDGELLPTSRAGLRAFGARPSSSSRIRPGSINPRQSIYEIVAEGLRIHRERAQRRGAVADALSDCGLRPARAVLPAISARAVRWATPACGHRRGDGAGAQLLVADEPVSSLDASVRGEILQLLLGLSRDRGMTDPGRHPRPRPGLEHRRPGRGDVPRPNRRDRHDRADPCRAAAPVHQGAALGRARARPVGSADPHRRGSRPDEHPGWLPVPSALSRCSRVARPNGSASCTPAPSDDPRAARRRRLPRRPPLTPLPRRARPELPSHSARRCRAADVRSRPIGSGEAAGEASRPSAFGDEQVGLVGIQLDVDEVLVGGAAHLQTGLDGDRRLRPVDRRTARFRRR